MSTQQSDLRTPGPTQEEVDALRQRLDRIEAALWPKGEGETPRQYLTRRFLDPDNDAEPSEGDEVRHG